MPGHRHQADTILSSKQVCCDFRDSKFTGDDFFGGKKLSSASLQKISSVFWFLCYRVWCTAARNGLHWCAVGWSEKPKSWKSKNVQADYLPRHSPDVRTVFEIKIRPLVFCEIGQMRFTEKGINFKKPRRRHFTEKSPNFMKPSQIWPYVTPLSWISLLVKQMWS